MEEVKWVVSKLHDRLRKYEELTKRIGVPLILGEDLDKLYKKIIEEENEVEYDDVQYIDLVYPPGSNPPTQYLSKKMNLITIKQIFLE